MIITDALYEVIMNFPSFRYGFRIIVSGVLFLFLLSPLFFTRADHALSVSVPPNQANVLRFGGGQYAVAPLASQLNLGAQFTMEAWIYLESTSIPSPFPSGVIIGKEDAQGAVKMVLSDGHLAFTYATSQPNAFRWAYSPTSFPLRTWTHAAATFDSGRMRLLINGTEVATQISASAPNTDSLPLKIGFNVNAALRQVRVWNRALNAAELTDNAARMLSGTEPGLAVYWLLNDGSGQFPTDLGPNKLPLQLGNTPNVDAISDPVWIKPAVLESGPYFSLEKVDGPKGIWGRLIDFNNDGFLDFVATYFAFILPGPTYAFQNDRNGHFLDMTSAVLGTQNIQTTSPRDFTLADFNGDGRMDLFIADHGLDAPPFPGGQSRILIQTPDGRLIDETNSRLPIENAFSHSCTAGDIDGDGDVDIYVGNVFGLNKIGPRFYVNDGKGYFQEDTTRIPSTIVLLQQKFTASKVVDIDLDGDLDLVLGGHPGGAREGPERDAILLNDGTGHFSFGPSNAMPLRIGGPTWGTVNIETSDFDNDGWPDLLMSAVREDYQETRIQLLLNNGDRTFRDAPNNIPQNWSPRCTVFFCFAADFNNDGWMDFVSSPGGDWQDGRRLFLNTGLGQFVDETELFPPLYAITTLVQPGDLDKDGKIDLVMVNGFGVGSPYYILHNLKPYPVAQAKPQASVSAANYSGLRLASESIVAAFGAGLATATQAASATPLPTSLAGTMIKVKDNLGVERLAPLFFVSPNQVNYQLPPGTSPGAATITISSADGTNFIGTRRIAPVAPGLFSANANGQSVAAAVALRVKADGTQSYENVARYDAARNQFVSVPLDLGPSTEQVFLVAFGTGFRFASRLSNVSVKMADADAQVFYAGSQGGLLGVDQVNVLIPRSLVGKGQVGIVLTVDGRMANPVTLEIK